MITMTIQHRNSLISNNVLSPKINYSQKMRSVGQKILRSSSLHKINYSYYLNKKNNNLSLKH